MTMNKLMNQIKRMELGCLIALIISIVPRIIMTLRAVPFRTISDETATIAGSAYLAGLDWSAVVSHAGYYGSGFTILLFPIFKMTDNPFIIYRVILVAACIFQGFIAWISYYLLKHYFKVKEKWFLCLSSIACSYMVVTRTSVVFNEHMLIFNAWLIALLLCKLNEFHNDKKKKAIFTVLLFVVLSYSLLLHTRAITLWFSLALVIGIVYLIEKRMLLSLPILVGCGGLGFLLSTIYIKRVQSRIWLAGESGNLRNATVHLGGGYDFTLIETWKAWLGIIFGQTNTIIFITGGLALIFLIRAFSITIDYFKTKKVDYRVRKEVLKQNEMQMESSLRSYTVILFLYFLFCIAATIFAQSFIWLQGATEAVQDGVGTGLYGVKAFTYIRYFGPYTGPIFMTGIAALYHKKIRKREILLTVLSGIIMQITWFVFDYPYIYNNSKANEPFVPLSLFQHGGETTWSTYLPASILLLILIGIFMISYFQNKKYMVISLILVFLFFQNGYATKYDISIAKKNLKRADAGYELVQKEEGKIDLPNVLYVKDSTNKTDHQIFYLYQFLLNRYQIIPELPKTEIETAIVFSNSSKETGLLDCGYEMAKLDKNEYLYAKGDLLIKLKNSSDLTFQDTPIE